MDSIVFDFLDGVIESVGLSGIFFSCLALSLISFAVCLTLALCLSGFTLKKRAWFFLLAVFFQTLDISLTLYGGGTALFPLILFAFNFSLVGTICLLPEKQPAITDESLSLAGFLSSKAKEQGKIDAPLERAEIERVTAGGGISFSGDTAEKEQRNYDLGLDFSHVKKVIERLNYFGLSPSDKRQVKDLESTILSAERGDGGDNVKECINDGLGALLKIMSKYGV